MSYVVSEILVIVGSGNSWLDGHYQVNSQYINQIWLVVNWTIQRNFDQNTKIYY